MYVINTVIPLAVLLSVLGAQLGAPVLNIIGQVLLSVGIGLIVATAVYGYVWKPPSQAKEAGSA